MTTIHYTTWGRGLTHATGLESGRCRMTDDDYSAIEAVARSLERRSGLRVCGGPRHDCSEQRRGRIVADQWQMTLGRPCRGGGYTPVAEVWVSVPFTGEVRP